MFGMAPGELARRRGRGVDALLDELVAPDAHGVAAAADPWAGATYTDEPGARRAEGLDLGERWLGAMTSSPRPLVEAMTWFWHDHFAVSYPVVRFATPFARYLSLLRTHALGDFRRLVLEITTDAAMLDFLDGATSTAAAPNENYGRELLELYTIGVGNFTEPDVRAAATALTGWVVRPRQGYSTQFVRTRHSSVPQTLLGRTVGDVASVVDAAVSHDACATFLAGKLAAWFLGPDHDPALVPGFAAVFRAGGLQIAPLVRAILRAGADGAGRPLVLAPVPWLVAAQKSLGVRLPIATALNFCNLAGQQPLAPPNVGGWPGPAAWLDASATAARVSMASALVDQLPASSPVLQAAAAADLAALATLLGRPAGFAPATVGALRSFAATRPAGAAGAAVAAIALASPDLLVA